MVGDINAVHWCNADFPNKLVTAWCILEEGHEGRHESKWPAAEWDDEGKVYNPK